MWLNSDLLTVISVIQIPLAHVQDLSSISVSLLCQIDVIFYTQYPILWPIKLNVICSFKRLIISFSQRAFNVTVYEHQWIEQSKVKSWTLFTALLGIWSSQTCIKQIDITTMSGMFKPNQHRGVTCLWRLSLLKKKKEREKIKADKKKNLS